MDLRPHLKNGPLFDEGLALIQQAKLWYQPFILADGVEVGEGQHLEDRYLNCQSLFDNNVFLDGAHRRCWEGNTRKLAADGRYFSDCNRKFRLCYERIAAAIVSRFDGDISGLSVLEIGCNTGLNLFNL